MKRDRERQESEARASVLAWAKDKGLVVREGPYSLVVEVDGAHGDPIFELMAKVIQSPLAMQRLQETSRPAE